MTSRRLAAILAADVVGYSAMMEDDEERTASRMRALRSDIIEPVLAQHSGRLIKTTGDGLFAEFSSPVQAVRAALVIQKRLLAAEGGLGLRIGINLGDVLIEDDGDVLGDGMNVATRLEQLARPGGVCISGSVYDLLVGKIDTSFEFGGEPILKNIVRPIRVYHCAETDRARSIKLLPLPDRPSIAVLPFTNLSGEQAQDYFAEGVAEDLIMALSRVRWFFVIARNSSFAYKGKAIDVRQVGRELGVRYILDGSLKKSRYYVRITASLVEAETGRQLWAARLDGELSDIFDLQDKITTAVVSAIEPSILLAEIDRAQIKPTGNLNAYDFYLRAMSHIYAYTNDDFVEAEKLLQRALKLDDRFSDAWSALSDSIARRTMAGWLDDWDDGRDRACSASARAVATDPENARALAMAACNLAMLAGRNDEALELADRSLQLHPELGARQDELRLGFHLRRKT